MLFLESKDTEVFKATRNKLFASSEKQINNQSLMLDMLHWYIPVVCTYCSFLIVEAEKATKDTELKSLSTQGTFQGEIVEYHRVIFTRHLQLTQSYIQAIIYIYKTDYIMSSTIVHIFYALCICWQQ